MNSPLLAAWNIYKIWNISFDRRSKMKPTWYLAACCGENLFRNVKQIWLWRIQWSAIGKWTSCSFLLFWLHIKPYRLFLSRHLLIWNEMGDSLLLNLQWFLNFFWNVLRQAFWAVEQFWRRHVNSCDSKLQRNLLHHVLHKYQDLSISLKWV